MRYWKNISVSTMLIKDLFTLILVVFATYRIAFEMSAHFGLFDAFHKMREYFQNLAIENPDKNFLFLDEFFRCATCLSLIVSIPFVVVFFRDKPLKDMLLIYFAVNGIIVWLHFRLLGE